MKAPPRLIDDAAASAELRSDLERVAASDAGYDVAAGLAALQTAITSSVAHSAAGASAAHAAGHAKLAASAQAALSAKSAGVLGSASVKLALAGLGTAAVVAVSVASWPAKPVPAPQPLPAVATQRTENTAHAPTMAAEAKPEPNSEPAASPEPNAVPAPATERAPASLSRSTPAPATEARPHARASGVHPGDDPALRREIAQLARIKSALERDPAEAYRLAQAGHREFTRGMLRQEREALAVLALAKLGRTTEAQQRGAAFVARYPDSPLREQIARMLGSEAPSP